MNDERGHLQIVRGIPTGYTCPHCDQPIEIGQVRIIRQGGRYDDVTQDFYRLAAEMWPQLVEDGSLTPQAPQA